MIIRKVRFGALSGAFIGAFLGVTTAYGFPLPQSSFIPEPKTDFALELVEKVDFTSIVALNNCSGSYVRFEKSLGSDRGMVLSNGHCYEGGFIDQGKFVADEKSTRTFQLLNAEAKKLAKLTAERILYATMSTTDVMIYQLNQTFDEIEKQHGVKPLTISSKHPSMKDPIALVSGYHKSLTTCEVDQFIYALHEDQWIFKDSIRYTDGCDSIPGSSGSPLINTDTNEVVGINNTGNSEGGKCTLNNPCEVDENGKVTVNKGTGYGQQVYLFYGCLDAKNQFDLTLKDCALPR